MPQILAHIVAAKAASRAVTLPNLMNIRTNLQEIAAVDAYKRLMAVSEKIRRGGLDAEDTVNVFLAVTLNLVLATSWGDNVVGFLRNAAEEYDSEVAKSLRQFYSEFEANRLRQGPEIKKD